MYTFIFHYVASVVWCLNGFLQEGRIALNLGRQTHIDVTISNNDNQATEDAGINSRRKLEALSFLQESIQCRFNILKTSSIQGLQ